MKRDQNSTPYIDALLAYMNENNVQFDVPGHHQNITTKLLDIDPYIYDSDFNNPVGMDSLSNPIGPLKEAEALLAEATGALNAKFLINGSTSGVLIMLLSTLIPDDKIILPRNVHKSVINGVILSGAKPIFLDLKIIEGANISTQNSFEEYKKAIDNNLDAKAVFIINPTYYGATTDLKRIVSYAHSKGMLVLADEAHGSHFYFSKLCPLAAIKAGADLSTLSFHKTCGSLTQSSVLLRGTETVEMAKINRVMNMINSTSPNAMLLSSIDAARHYMANFGAEKIKNIIALAGQARKEINQIPGFICLDKEYFLKTGSLDYDDTRILIKLDHMSISGFELFRILKLTYGIQVELGEANVILLILSLGTTRQHIQRLLEALKSASHLYYNPTNNENYMEACEHSIPPFKMTPNEALKIKSKYVKYDDLKDKISCESIMLYPPGIPFIIPGEVFTEEVVELLKYYSSIHAKVITERADGTISVVDDETK